MSSLAKAVYQHGYRDDEEVFRVLGTWETLEEAVDAIGNPDILSVAQECDEAIEYGEDKESQFIGYVLRWGLGHYSVEDQVATALWECNDKTNRQWRSLGVSIQMIK
jgi:hypothetical protein